MGFREDDGVAVILLFKGFASNYSLNILIKLVTFNSKFKPIFEPHNFLVLKFNLLLAQVGVDKNYE